MKDFVKRMIEEHAALLVKIDKLNDYIYSDKSNADDTFEFANKCIQLSAMRTYETALRARLINQNIAILDDGSYFEKIAQICETPDAEPQHDEQENNNEQSNEPVLE